MYANCPLVESLYFIFKKLEFVLEGRGGGCPCTVTSKMNKFEHVQGLAEEVGPGSCTGGRRHWGPVQGDSMNKMTYSHHWKHYLPATSLAAVNMNLSYTENIEPWLGNIPKSGKVLQNLHVWYMQKSLRWTRKPITSEMCTIFFSPYISVNLACRHSVLPPAPTSQCVCNGGILNKVVYIRFCFCRENGK